MIYLQAPKRWLVCAWVQSFTDLILCYSVFYLTTLIKQKPFLKQQGVSLLLQSGIKSISLLPIAPVAFPPLHCTGKLSFWMAFRCSFLLLDILRLCHAPFGQMGRSDKQFENIMVCHFNSSVTTGLADVKSTKRVSLSIHKMPFLHHWETMTGLLLRTSRVEGDDHHDLSLNV